MNKPNVRKAVIAAAGFGTRFLPQTKAMPKEMLPLVDKPIIQYVVEELVEAGIEDIIIVTGYHKRTIEDHFDTVSADLEKNLVTSNKQAELKKVQAVSNLANFAYVRQKGPYGNATPLLNAQHLIGDEPFIYTYADDLILSEPNRFTQMIHLYEKLHGSIVPCIPISKDEDYARYGVVGGTIKDEGVLNMTSILEKPGKAAAPSNLASVGGYLLTPDIYRYLESDFANFNGDGEFQLQPSMRRMMNEGGKFYACELVNSHYYDTGNKLEYLKTVVDFALQHDDLREEFQAYLANRLER